jgi:hypothetical protein
MLDPTRLCSLDLAPFRPRGIGHFLDDAGAMAAFRNLRTLPSTFPDTDFTRIHACIAPFPAVCELIFYLKGSCLADAISPAPLAPHLESYRGPAALLPLVPAGSAPEALTVTQGSAADALEALRAAMRPDFVTSLSMGVWLHSHIIRHGTLLEHIVGLYLRLARLTLDGSNYGEDFDAATVFLTSIADLRLTLIRSFVGDW